MKSKLKYLFISFFISCYAFAQTGIVTGKVIEADTNEALAFASVIVKGTDKGVTTDFEGKYTLNLPEGTYNLAFSFLGFDTKEISDIKVTTNHVSNLDVTLKAAGISIETIVISASSARNTEVSILATQQKSINLMDGISSQTFQKLSVSDVAAAIKNVPGVSVQDAKYVYVRGLGDRYTKSILNGVDIPGLDPDRNTVQLDVFPTNIIDNIQVIKSSTADLPADFTGGMVNIITKDFPTQKTYSLGVGGSFNPTMHFNANYLKYKGSATDVLGFDNGTRQLPISRNQFIPGPFSNNPALTTIIKAFNPILKASKGTSAMDFNFSFTAGNQYTLKNDHKIGYLAAISYKNSTSFFRNYETGTYRKAADKAVNELELSDNQIGDIGKNEVLLSGLAGLTYKTDRSKYKLNILHLQNGESTAGYLKQTKVFTDAVNIYKDNLQYTQRAISNLLLTGKHSNKDASFLTEWTISPTYSLIQDKDWRITPFVFDEPTNTYSIRPSSGGSPKRIWRNLDEIDVVSKIDFTLKHMLFSKPSKLLFGGNFTYKNRNFSIDNYIIAVRGSAGETLNGNANELLKETNIWTASTGVGTYIEGNYEPANTYNAYNNNFAFYSSESLLFSDKLKAIIGLRLEKFEQFYTGQNNNGTIVFDKVKTIDKFDLFPSANFIYNTNDQTNIRLSYSKTVARPSFKETSITQIFDPISNFTFNGNINLQPSYINNFDVRYENFGEDAQLFALSAFYKTFKNPIELAFFSASAPDNLQPRNIGSATVYGLEIDIRKNLDFLGDAFNKFSINGNASVIKSSQLMDKSLNGEYESKLQNLRVGQTLSDKRSLQGQSPYLINAGLNYTDDHNGLQTGLFFNVQGKSLEVVGIGAISDVYTLPFNSLNFTMNKDLGREKKSTINFKIENLLNNDIESHYQSFGSSDKIFLKKHIGMSFSFGYHINF